MLLRDTRRQLALCYATMLVLALVPAIPASQARAGTPLLRQTAFLTAHDGAKGDIFGTGLAISADGKTALIGAPFATVRGVGQSGAVYIYTKSTSGAWRQQIEITDPHPGRSYGVGSWFGYSVALSASGGAAVVSAPHACEPVTCTNTLYGQEGAVYVYTRTGRVWTQTAVLTNPHKAYRDNFGTAVSLTGAGTSVLVGSSGAQANNSPAAAYIFTQSGGGWTTTGQLTAPDSQNDQSYSFGSAVTISRNGMLAVIGAPHVKVGSADDQGTAYTYTNTNGTWSRATELTAVDGTSDQEFGTSVAVAQPTSGAIALIGSSGILTPCPCLNPHSTEGNAYVFAKSLQAWHQTVELHDPAHTSWDGFGAELVLSADGSHALISAPFTYWWTAPNATGRAYLYTNTRGRWTLARQFINPNNGERDYYGGRAAFSEAASTLIISANGYPGDTTPNSAQGAVYIYT